MKKKRKYIYLEKCLIIRILQIYIFSFYDFLFFISLSYAELREYILEDVVGGDFAGDLTKVVDCGADILAQQFRRESMLQSVQSRIQRRERFAQGVVVALVGDDGLAAVCRRRVHAARERRDKCPYPLARLGREP